MPEQYLKVVHHSFQIYPIIQCYMPVILAADTEL
jgi:hypothetical protein